MKGVGVKGPIVSVWRGGEGEGGHVCMDVHAAG